MTGFRPLPPPPTPHPLKTVEIQMTNMSKGQVFKKKKKNIKSSFHFCKVYQIIPYCEKEVTLRQLLFFQDNQQSPAPGRTAYVCLIFWLR